MGIDDDKREHAQALTLPREFQRVLNGARPIIEDALNKWVDRLQIQGNEPEFDTNQFIEYSDGTPHRLNTFDRAMYTLKLRAFPKLSIKQPIHLVADESVQQLIVYGLECPDGHQERYEHYRTFNHGDIESPNLGALMYDAIGDAVRRVIDSAK
ncbi:hypothetical protein [Polyangium fumosum]|uniref:Uncharacterized protein n=1 Tax=Polyangium fumosum TaxID=889272 RepID=A0A4V6WQP9_9BACT|nr:hypothetical protein [Polyangium fumosum]TKD03051.1 hypothetical protein E8A74_27355 [Polyangium fumosum]